MKQKKATTILSSVWFILNFVLLKTKIYEDSEIVKGILIMVPCVLSGVIIDELICEWQGERRWRSIVNRAVMAVLLLAIACVYLFFT